MILFPRHMFLPYLILLVFQISIDDDEQSSESQVMDTAVQTTTETSEKRTCTDYSITGTVSKGLVHDTERLMAIYKFVSLSVVNYGRNTMLKFIFNEITVKPGRPRSCL